MELNEEELFAIIQSLIYSSAMGDFISDCMNTEIIKDLVKFDNNNRQALIDKLSEELKRKVTIVSSN